MRSALIAAVAIGLLAAPASAETITYTYDALGRLVTVVHTGGRNDGVNAVYNYDKADNRTSVQVTGNNLPIGGATGAGVSSTTIYIVVPLNGFATVRAK